jgi:hypothetical protein
VRRVAFRHSGSPRFRRACCLPRVAAAPADVVALHEHRCERNTNEHSTVTFATAPAPRKSRCVRATRRAAPRRGAVSRVVVNHYTSVRPTASFERRKIANRNKRYDRRSAFAHAARATRLGRKRKGRYALPGVYHTTWCGDTSTSDVRSVTDP